MRTGVQEFSQDIGSENYRRVREACSEEVIREYSRYDKVIEALSKRRFVRLILKNSDVPREYWIFLGKDRDYILIPCMYCSCPDFTINVLSRRSKNFCYHLVALEIARRSSAYRELQVGAQEFKKIVLEVLIDGMSLTIRKLLYRI